ncbi:MAG TPA: hypothetical protein DCL43_13125 [Chitinophagaceae bacterium]|nr:hypothetical protein [Chitinophagaceae bacterium]HAN38446.1 hypothetical protein [Chitinophagaceae bacterium]
MNKFLFFFLSIFFFYTRAQAQQVIVAITVADSLGSPLPNSSITIAKSKQYYVTDSSGRVSFPLAIGNHSISISHTGFYKKTFRINSNTDTSFVINLTVNVNALQAVTVTSTNRFVGANKMSTQIIDVATLKKLPVVFGEVDPLKAIALLPGVKNGGDASSGIYVRGGGPDQNLVLLDGTPIYNPNHLLGFFSIFNGDAVKDIEVIKGGIPAEYGGRLSSVINVETRTTRKDSIRYTGGVGLISSRLGIEGPIVKNKVGFMLNVRRTYADALARLAAPQEVGSNGYFFYDINAKVDWQLNNNNNLALLIYHGQDDFLFVNERFGRRREFNTYYGNTVIGLRWQQRITSRLQQTTNVTYNRFNLDSRFGFSSLQFLFSSGIRDYSVQTNFNYRVSNQLQLKWGGQYLRHRFTPGAGGVTTGLQDFKSQLQNQFANEWAAYASAAYDIGARWNISAGLRYSIFEQVGPTTLQQFDAEGNALGASVTYGRGQSIAQYQNPEPRLNLLYRIDSKSSIKASYTKTAQYLHLATTSSATFPSDLWVPSSNKVQPSIAHQFAIGYFTNWNDNTYEFSVEAYYKSMDNQIEIKPGAQLILNQNLEGEMIFGSGKAYGVELFVQKKKGRLTGWLGYTLSRTERTFAALNNGQPFPFRYDRTHDVSLVANYKINRKWDANFVFVYGTGNALTLPNGRFVYMTGVNVADQQPIFTNINRFDAINSFRMPAYHRADISFTYTRKPNSNKRFKSSWNFGIYNLYNRANPFFIYVDVDQDQQKVQGKKVYLFPITPSATWNFSF